MKTAESAITLMIVCFILSDTSELREENILSIMWLLIATLWLITAIYRQVKSK